MSLSIYNKTTIKLKTKTFLNQIIGKDFNHMVKFKDRVKEVFTIHLKVLNKTEFNKITYHLPKCINDLLPLNQ